VVSELDALPQVASRTSQDVLATLEKRVRWLSSAIIHHANYGRPNLSGIKVGGHQASSASMTSIMTTLWWHALNAEDRVSVKPHASPVLHAINYMLGELDESYLPTLRSFGGLQSYPSRTKDPDPVDYSTGSVGIGATAAVWGAIARRYVSTRTGVQSAGRQYALMGDAELDEGAIWEAVVDPMVARLGELVWVVDLNRQSLDRVVPTMAANRLEGMFRAAGWQVMSLKYGRRLQELFHCDGGELLRGRIDEMSNPEYQRLLRCSPSELRDRLPGNGHGRSMISRLLDQSDDIQLCATLRDLGGHDLSELTRAYDAIDDERPTIIIAYTIKGYGLPTEGHPQNHSALLTDAQMRELAGAMGANPDDPWALFPKDSSSMRACRSAADRLRRATTPAVPIDGFPTDFRRTPRGSSSTQQGLGRVLLDLSREAPAVAARVVTVSPDVASSTNLGGWLNKVGAWSPQEGEDWFADDRETLLHWRESPSGQHIELGIAETNLVGLLGELGATWSRWGHSLLPIGTLYDPFIGRALEPWSFGIYAGGQSILVGTPSGISLAPEGGAHQSITTPGIGLQQPGCVAYEPAFLIDLEWTLLDALSHVGRPGGRSAYFRLSTRPVDQVLAAVPAEPEARDRRRRQVLAGAYPLRRHPEPAVTLVGMGAVMPELLVAAEQLQEWGYGADVVCVTSADLIFQATQARDGLNGGSAWILDEVFSAERARPMVTVLDGHPHTLAFLGAIHPAPSRALGVTEFGQSGDLPDLYRHFGIDGRSVACAAAGLLGLAP